MGLFKSEKEKMKIQLDKIKENWKETSEYHLGITFEESDEVEKTVHKGMIDAVGQDGFIKYYEPINVLFPNLTPKQKVMILYYARWYKTNIEV